MKVALCILCILAMASAESWFAAPYTLVKRAASPEPLPEPQRYTSNRRGSSSSRRGGTSTRFFTGNGAVDAGAAGLAAGLATSYFTNQIFNPCRRGGTRTNNRLGGNTGNFLLGAAVGWAGGTLINNALCNGRK